MSDPTDKRALSTANFLLDAICTVIGVDVIGADRYGPAREACERFVESVRANEGEGGVTLGIVADMLRDDTAAPSDCVTSPFVSRACERGTHGCNVRHDAPSEEGEGPSVYTSDWQVPPEPESVLREKLAAAERRIAELETENSRLVRAIRAVPTDPIYTLRSRILAAAQGVCEEHGRSLPCGACDGADAGPTSAERIAELERDKRTAEYQRDVLSRNLARTEDECDEYKREWEGACERLRADPHNAKAWQEEGQRQRARIAELEAERESTAALHAKVLDAATRRADALLERADKAEREREDIRRVLCLERAKYLDAQGAAQNAEIRCSELVAERDELEAERDTLAEQMRDATAHIIGLDDALAKADRERDAAVKRAEELQRAIDDANANAPKALTDALESLAKRSTECRLLKRDLEQARAALKSLETRARAKARQSSEYRDASTTEHDRTVHSAQSLALWQFADEIAALSPARLDADLEEERAECGMCGGGGTVCTDHRECVGECAFEPRLPCPSCTPAPSAADEEKPNRWGVWYLAQKYGEAPLFAGTREEAIAWSTERREDGGPFRIRALMAADAEAGKETTK